MRLLGSYIFSLLIIGMFGLCLGHWSRSMEVSMLQQWINQQSAITEKEISVRGCIEISQEHNCSNNRLAHVGQTKAKNLVDPKNYMKQVAHVHVPQNNSLLDVSKTLDESRLNAKCAQLQQAYIHHLEHVIHVLENINHSNSIVRIRARLEMARLQVAGPLGKYIHTLTNELLVRYCAQDGKLLISEYDGTIKKDVECAIQLLESECTQRIDMSLLKSQEFDPFARKVQQHPYNKMLMT